MNEFVKETIIPIIVVLSALASCMVSVCLYHCIRYIAQVRELHNYEKLKDNEGEEVTELETEKIELSRKSSVKSSFSATSLTSLPHIPEVIEYNTIGDLEDFLRLRGIVINATYNYDRGYLQVSVLKITLYPLPEDAGSFIRLQYTISFSIKDVDVFESEMRQLRQTLRFDERYRIYTSQTEVDGAEMVFNISALDNNFKRIHLWNVRYTLKTVMTFSSSDAGQTPDDPDVISDLEKVVQVQCIKEITEGEKSPKILMSLCYKPTSGRLFVRLIKGENFPESAHRMRMKLVLIQTKYGSVRSLSSPTMNNCSNPIIDEIFTLGISMKNIQSAVLAVSLLYGLEGKSFVQIAGTKLGSLSAAEEGRRHWNEMLDTIREEVEAWHTLRDDIS